MVLVALQEPVAAEAPAKATLWPTKSVESFVVSSDTVILGCADDGNWGLETVDPDPETPDEHAKPLTYARNGWSNGLSAVVDGSLHVLDHESGNPEQYLCDPMTWDEAEKAAFIAWQIDGVHLRERLELVVSDSGRRDTVKATYRFEHAGTSDAVKTVSLKVGLDIRIGDNDAAELATAAGVVAAETGFGVTGNGGSYPVPVPDFWQASEFASLANPGLIGQGTFVGTGAVKPDKFVVGDWFEGVSSGVAFDYEPSGLPYADSAVAMWWFDRALAPGESVSFVLYYGLGAMFSAGNDLTVALSAPAALARDGADFTPNPFTLLVQLQNTTDNDVMDVPVTLGLPPCLSVADGGGLTRLLGSLTAGCTELVPIQLYADPACAGQTVDYNVRVEPGGDDDASLRGYVALPALPTRLTITRPNGGETLQRGTLEPITWTSVGSVSSVTIEAYDGMSWHTIATDEPNDGIYPWTVAPASTDKLVSGAPAAKGGCGWLLRISDSADGAVSDRSDGPFCVEDGNRFVRVLSVSHGTGDDDFPQVAATVRVDTDRGRQCLLTASDVSLWEDGVSQTVASVTCAGVEGSVADIALVIDDTGSMEQAIATLKGQATDFAAGIRDGGVDARFALVSFGDTAHIDQTFTDDPLTFQTAVNALKAGAGGDTPEAALDAVMTAVTELTWRPGAQHIVVLLTDAPTHHRDDGSGVSTYTVTEVVDAVNQAGTAVFAVGPLLTKTLWNNARKPILKAYGDAEDVRTLAEDTGGFWQEMDHADFGVMVTHIADAVTSLYTVRYITANAVPDGTERRVSLAVDDAVQGTDSDVSVYSAPLQDKMLVLTRPNGGEDFTTGKLEAVTWYAQGPVQDVIVEYSDDNGSLWRPVAQVPAKEGVFAWIVPPPSVASAEKAYDGAGWTATKGTFTAPSVATTAVSKTAESTACGYRIRVRDAADGSVSDLSDAPFCIAGVPNFVDVLSLGYDLDPSRFPVITATVRVESHYGRTCQLERAHVSVVENGIPQEVRAVTCAATGGSVLDLALIFDDTGSMSDQIALMQRKAGDFVRQILAVGVDARVALVSFADTAEIDQDFTADADTFQEAVNALTAAGGGDAPEGALDAVVAALESLSWRSASQRILVLVTDAPAHHRDDGSGVSDCTMDQVVDAVRASGAAVFAAGPLLAGGVKGNDGTRVDKAYADPADVSTLAENTGGFWQDIDRVDFSSFVDTIVDVVTSLYTVTYTTSGTAMDGGQRSVVIAVDDPLQGADQAEAVYVAPHTDGPLRVVRSLPACASAGQTVPVILTVTYSGDDPVTDLRLVETLPDGWAFQNVVSTPPPATAPESGATGRLEFSWDDPPAFPLTLAYDVAIPGRETFSDGVRLETSACFEGSAAYRCRSLDFVVTTQGDLCLEGGPCCVAHSSDQNGDWTIQLSPELTRLIQFYNSGGYHCEPGTEDGFAPGPGPMSGEPHRADQNADGCIQLSPELTRIIQFYNSGGYHCDEGTEDGYSPGLPGTRTPSIPPP